MNKTRIGGTSARQINLPFFPSRGSSSSSSQTPLSQGCRGSYLHLSRLQPSTFFSYVDVILPRCSSSPLPRAAARCPTRAHVRARYARVCPAEEAYPEGGYPGVAARAIEATFRIYRAWIMPLFRGLLPVLS